MARFVNPFDQYFDGAGDPLVGGKLQFLATGSETDLDTFMDANLTVANTNPVILDGAGRIPNIFLQEAAYKVRLFDSDDVQIDERDPVGGESETGSFPVWDTATIYDVPDIVLASDGEFYQSITSGNQSNNPVTSPLNWTQVNFVPTWNANVTYASGEIALGSDGIIYSSLVGSNLGNDPVSNPTEWGPSSLLGSNAGFTTTQTVFKALSGSSIQTDTITETTSDAGVTIDSVTMKDGNVVFINGKGLDFTATPGAPGVTSSLFDEYEEGTWTPAFWDDSLSDEDATYDIQVGEYTRVGRSCHIEGTLQTTGLGSLVLTENARIGNLPFTSATLANEHASMTFGFGTGLATTAGDSIVGSVFTATNHISIRKWANTSGTPQVLLSAISNTGQLSFSGTYEVA